MWPLGSSGNPLRRAPTIEEGVVRFDGSRLHVTLGGVTRVSRARVVDGMLLIGVPVPYGDGWSSLVSWDGGVCMREVGCLVTSDPEDPGLTAVAGWTGLHADPKGFPGMYSDERLNVELPPGVQLALGWGHWAMGHGGGNIVLLSFATEDGITFERALSRSRTPWAQLRTDG